MPAIDDYQPSIGLEVHVQLNTATKMFCRCESVFGAEPNSRTCPVCLGLPGSLPVLNSSVAEMAAKAVLATGGQINRNSIFARKNYFYPDLPKGYQISQYDQPFGLGGRVLYTDSAGDQKQCDLTRIHLEEDAGKLLHPEAEEPNSRIDFNRCGVPLLEIVTEPEIASPSEAHSYLAALKQLLQYIEISNADMEKGELRCDANVSVRKRGDKQLGVRTEIKNLNSFRAVERALQTEIERQVDLLESGHAVEQATLLWDESTQQVELMRTKEESEDYRYFPEPDLPPVNITEDQIADFQRDLPELPLDRLRRLTSEYSVREDEATVLTATRGLADYFEAVARKTSDPETAAHWIATELLGQLHRRQEELSACKVAPEQLADLLLRIKSGEISGKIAKSVLVEMLETGVDSSEIISRKGLAQISDREALRAVVDEVLARNSEIVNEFRNGKVKLLPYLVGQIMKATGGTANPEVINNLLKKKLAE